MAKDNVRELGNTEMLGKCNRGESADQHNQYGDELPEPCWGIDDGEQQEIVEDHLGEFGTKVKERFLDSPTNAKETSVDAKNRSTHIATGRVCSEAGDSSSRSLGKLVATQRQITIR